MYEEHLARENNSLRKCAERCLLTLADTSECRQPVQQTVLRLSNEAAAADLSSVPALFVLDACYFALGLVLQSGQDAYQLADVLNMLQQHCSLAATGHAHLLRRRAAWLVGLTLRTPYFARMAQDTNASSDTMASGYRTVTLMYAMLSELLGDENPGEFRKYAALAICSLFAALTFRVVLLQVCAWLQL